MDNTCEFYEKCPIYNDILKDAVMTSKAYRQQYCEAGEDGRKTCKRYQVRVRAGKCPPNVLPNSARDVESIIAEMAANT